MSVRIPLVIVAGQIEQLQAGDSISTGSIAVNAHLVSANFTITAGTSLVVTRYEEIAAGITLEIGADGDLEIG